MLGNVLASLVLAASPVTSVQESFTHPIPKDFSTADTIVLEAPHFAWFIRPVARELDAVLSPSLNFIYYRGVSCADYENIICVRVTVEPLEPSVGGRWQVTGLFTSWWTDHKIMFNSLYSGRASRPLYKRATACHELLHALGFFHHDQEGCANPASIVTSPSVAEYTVLIDYYTTR